MIDTCKIAVIGATGVVGRLFLRILEERHFPTSHIRLCASKKSTGKTLTVKNEQIPIEDPTSELLSEVDIAFISANSTVSREIAPMAVTLNTLVIDDSSSFRMDPEVPLVVPEVNASDLDLHRGIISIPNCSTTPLVMILNPLHKINPVKRVIVDTYQSVSGSGTAAIGELRTQSKQILEGSEIKPNIYPYQIAFNTIPHIGPFTDSGYTEEELKIRNETRKILHAPNMAISATCIRVPVMVSHSEAVHIEFTNPITPEEVRGILSTLAGICVIDDPQSNAYPMPIEAAGKDKVLVGRIRRDISHSNGIALWIVSDNLRKGAALNALQIAEEIISRELLLRRN